MSEPMDRSAALLPALQAAEAKLLLQTYERNPILFVVGKVCTSSMNKATATWTC